MLTIGNNQYRNLQEQVLKNKDDIANILQGNNIAELGIQIKNAEEPLESAANLPNANAYDGDYGDGYIVGTETPFRLYVYSRSSDPAIKGYWFDFGLLNAPSTIQGPIGPQGIQGPQGTRGSLWYSQSGVPTVTEGVNNNDQAIDGTTGDIYQFVNNIWQLTGNIRGPQGIQGIQGPIGPEGVPGPRGFKGDKGDAGQFIEIIGTLENINQLPDPSTVARSSAYLIVIDGAEHIYLIIGEGTTESPLLWHDAGTFGGGTSVTIDGINQNTVPLDYVPKVSINYQIGDDTIVTTNGSEVTFSNLQTSGQNVANDDITGLGVVELPIASSDQIKTAVKNNTLQFNLTENVWNEVQSIVDDAAPIEVQITAPTTSTNGQLTEEQLATLQANTGAYLMFNNEIYRLQDTQHISGYLIYSHLGYNNTTATYMIKCITITISTRGWVLTTRTVMDPDNYSTTAQMNTAINNAKPSNFASNKAGLVPAPTSTQYSANYYLKGNGTFGQLIMTYTNGTLTITKS